MNKIISFWQSYSRWTSKGPKWHWAAGIGGPILLLLIALGSAGGEEAQPESDNEVAEALVTATATSSSQIAPLLANQNAGTGPTTSPVSPTPQATTVPTATVPAPTATSIPPTVAPTSPAPSQLVAAASATQAPAPPPPTATTAAAASGRVWYTSSHSSADYYYCDLDDGWKNLSPTYLKSYPSETALLAEWAGLRVKHPSSRC